MDRTGATMEHIGYTDEQELLIDELESTILDRDIEIAELKQIIENRDKEIEELDGKLSAEKEKAGLLLMEKQLSLQNHIIRVEELESKLLDKSIEIAELRNDNKDQALTIDKLYESLGFDTDSPEIQAEQHKIEELMDEKVFLQGELDAVTADRNRLQRERLQLNRNQRKVLDDYEDEVGRLKNIISTYQNRLTLIDNTLRTMGYNTDWVSPDEIH